MKASFDPRGGGPRSIRVEDDSGFIHWLTFDEACDFEDQLGVAMYNCEVAKWEDSLNSTQDGPA